eukprot:Gregarina_sp_Poly_1__6947@NODE_377_length_9088_cov_94_889924_g310_i0_p6_GENE_NODE_377_length_9088_cov_94_889924_g310_i0NODE_377_length_9088_cov_94_889924_g310_i0_p6_ORF_typecomplete_len142_score18_37_NODE_377_length_9088_cov_94_889924_g310_i039934418
MDTPSHQLKRRLSNERLSTDNSEHQISSPDILHSKAAACPDSQVTGPSIVGQGTVEFLATHSSRMASTEIGAQAGLRKQNEVPSTVFSALSELRINYDEEVVPTDFLKVRPRNHASKKAPPTISAPPIHSALIYLKSNSLC